MAKITFLLKHYGCRNQTQPSCYLSNHLLCMPLNFELDLWAWPLNPFFLPVTLFMVLAISTIYPVLGRLISWWMHELAWTLLSCQSRLWLCTVCFDIFIDAWYWMLLLSWKLIIYYYVKHSALNAHMLHYELHLYCMYFPFMDSVNCICGTLVYLRSLRVA